MKSIDIKERKIFYTKHPKRVNYSLFYCKQVFSPQQQINETRINQQIPYINMQGNPSKNIGLSRQVRKFTIKLNPFKVLILDKGAYPRQFNCKVQFRQE